MPSKCLIRECRFTAWNEFLQKSCLTLIGRTWAQTDAVLEPAVDNEMIEI